MSASETQKEIRHNSAIRVGSAMHGLAIAILLGVMVWGAFLYPDLPDLIPIHWNAAGVADDLG